MINPSISDPDVIDVSPMELRQNLSTIIHQIQYSNTQFRLKSHNTTVARLVSENFIKSVQDLLAYNDGLREDFESVLAANEARQMDRHSQNDVQNADLLKESRDL